MVIDNKKKGGNKTPFDLGKITKDYITKALSGNYTHDMCPGCTHFNKKDKLCENEFRFKEMKENFIIKMMKVPDKFINKSTYSIYPCSFSSHMEDMAEFYLWYIQHPESKVSLGFDETSSEFLKKQLQKCKDMIPVVGEEGLKNILRYMDGQINQDLSIDIEEFLEKEEKEEERVKIDLNFED